MATSTSTHTSAHDVAAKFSPRQRKWAVTIVALAFVMDLLDSTIVNIAIPSIQANLHASYTAIQWLIAGYSLTFALLLITGGRMGDVFGYKKVFLIGVAGFTVASLLCGLAWSPEILVAARLIQGCMAALMVPQVMSVMQIMYKPEERAGVSGMFGMLGGMAAVLGPIVGALLIQANFFNLDWRPIFLINIPVGIAALIAAWKVLPEGKSPHPLHLDLVGTGIILVALFMLAFPLMQGRELGWPLWTFLMMVAAVPMLALFAWYETRKMARDGSPLVVPQLFHERAFLIGMIVNLVFEMALVGYFLTSTLLLQAGLGYSVLHAGLTGIPFSIGVGFSIGFLGQQMIPRFGRYLMAIGAAVMATGFVGVAWTATHFGLSTHSWQLAPSLILGGLGMGMVMAPLFAVVLSGVDIKHAGSASGILNAVQQIGGAIGVALIGVIFFGQLSHQAGAKVESVTPQLRADLTAAHVPTAAQDQIVNGFKVCYTDRMNAKDSSVTPDSCKQDDSAQAQIPAQMSKDIEGAVTKAAKEANQRNFTGAFNWGVGSALILLLMTTVLSFFLPKKIRPEATEIVA